MSKEQPVPINNQNYAAWAASASVPTEEQLHDDDKVFIGGSTNVSLLGTTSTTTTT